MTLQELLQPGSPIRILKTRGLKDNALYHFVSRPAMMNVKPMKGRFASLSSDDPAAGFVRMPRETEDYTLYGDLLNHGGIRLKSDFNGHNLDEDTRYYIDYSTRFYDIELVKE